MDGLVDRISCKVRQEGKCMVMECVYYDMNLGRCELECDGIKYGICSM
jgi:hypothetical protein